MSQPEFRAKPRRKAVTLVVAIFAAALIVGGLWLQGGRRPGAKPVR